MRPSIARAPIRFARSEGSALLLVLVVLIVFGFVLTFVLTQGRVEARAGDVQMRALDAFHTARGELALARFVTRHAGYTGGRNDALQAALKTPDRWLAGTGVKVSPMAGEWYLLSVAVPYAGDYQRVLVQTVREKDYFSSYNLFVAEHSVGVSGEPRGAVHSNRQIEFYFPDGTFRDSVTAAEGFVHKAGADPSNTSLLGPYDPAADPIELAPYLEGDDVNLASLEGKADPDLSFDRDVGLDMRFHVKGDEQWVRIEKWSEPFFETRVESVKVGEKLVRPREETFKWKETVQKGTEDVTVKVKVLDHYETETRTEHDPIYETLITSSDEWKKVWVTGGGGGGTTVASGGEGEGGGGGYWDYRLVPVKKATKVIVGYEKVEREKKIPIYRTEERVETRPVYEKIERSETRTVHDREPIFEDLEVTRYVPPKRLSRDDFRVPSGGLIFTKGSVWSVAGDVLGRVTVASEGSITIGDNLRYVDADGDRAFHNGDKPWLPYERNPGYDGSASLGLIARDDVLYSRSLPTRAEINASLLAVKGRVGVEGITLDASGNVAGFNRFHDRKSGDDFEGSFLKESLRRFGGITSAKRCVDTVVEGAAIVAGFQMGESVFDEGAVAGPPPYFLSRSEPRFFEATVAE